jgi:hypothetical protein
MQLLQLFVTPHEYFVHHVLHPSSGQVTSRYIGRNIMSGLAFVTLDGQ